MKVFAGPPGTGKTWRAAREAVRILRPGTPEGDVQRVHQELVEEGRILWITFHPSYSYEDFVEGFRPEETPSGNVVYSIAPGPFLRACQAASSAVSANRFSVGQKLGPYRVSHIEAGGIVLESVTKRKRKDAVATDEDEPAQGFVDFWTLRRFAEHDLPVSDFRLSGAMNARRKVVSRLTGVPTTSLNNASRHAAVYEALKSEGVVVKATEIVLIIDEINRADLSRVFGELITLLEFDKRQGASEERQINLTYSGKPLTVPATLSVIGTMNTADKSLSTVDLALRRRFEFIMVPPDPALVPTTYGAISVREKFALLNRRLAALNGSENLIGHADFLEDKLEELREREGYGDSDGGRAATLAHLLRKKTVPFLIDLFRNDWTFVRFVVGDELFVEDALTDLNDELQALGRLDAEPILALADWWDPAASVWDAERLSRRLAMWS